MWGPTYPELMVPIIERASVKAFDDPKVAEATTATGCKKLFFVGISLEVCAAFPAITAVGNDLDPYVAVDAFGTSAKPNDRSVSYACCRDRLGLREPDGES
jgi:nicotinamidase-related amidase